MTNLGKKGNSTPDTWGEFKDETLMFAAEVCLNSRNASMRDAGLHDDDAPHKVRAFLIILISIILAVTSVSLIFDSLAPESQTHQTHALSKPDDSGPIGNPIFVLENKPAMKVEPDGATPQTKTIAAKAEAAAK
ncbi:hypothetical protein MNBD_GAMMA26-1937 [hydrothermal vent metagenome]|uniref:Uncharacterized protein n=1 Tax=hydrothermal vent metagenome TaxID=652676 RepID=A0A3B1B4B7_9ZZZZ